MPRGDEIEADESRESRRRRSTRSYDDERDARDARYDRDDGDDDYRSLRRKKPRQRSGLVLAAGIVTIILSTLYLLCGVLNGAAGACASMCAPVMRPALAQAAAQGDPKAAKLANDMRQVQSIGWLALFEAVLNLVLGTALLVGGICVLWRWNWARFLIIGFAGLGVIAELFDILLKLVLRFFQGPGDALMAVAFLLVSIAYAGFVWIALLLPASSKDFAH